MDWNHFIRGTYLNCQVKKEYFVWIFKIWSHLDGKQFPSKKIIQYCSFLTVHCEENQCCVIAGWFRVRSKI